MGSRNSRNKRKNTSTYLTILTIIFCLIAGGGTSFARNGTGEQVLLRTSPFGSHFIELRGQVVIGDGGDGHAFHLEYKYRWFEYMSTDIFIRRFPFSSYELGGGTTVRVPFAELFFLQGAVGIPIFKNPMMFHDAINPDFSLMARGGLMLPLFDPARSPLFIIFSGGKVWYVDTDYRYYYRFAATPPPYNDFNNYEIRTRRETRDFLLFEIGIGVHF